MTPVCKSCLVHMNVQIFRRPVHAVMSIHCTMVLIVASSDQTVMSTNCILAHLPLKPFTKDSSALRIVFKHCR
jgi:hypothetical protein